MSKFSQSNKIGSPHECTYHAYLQNVSNYPPYVHLHNGPAMYRQNVPITLPTMNKIIHYWDEVNNKFHNTLWRWVMLYVFIAEGIVWTQSNKKVNKLNKDLIPIQDQVYLLILQVLQISIQQTIHAIITEISAKNWLILCCSEVADLCLWRTPDVYVATSYASQYWDELHLSIGTESKVWAIVSCVCV